MIANNSKDPGKEIVKSIFSCIEFSTACFKCFNTYANNMFIYLIIINPWRYSPEEPRPTEALLILQPFRHFTYVTTHSPTLPSFHLRHISFSNPSVALPTSQLVLQPFFRFYVTSSSLNSPGEPLMADLILQPFRHFTYVTTHSPTLLSLYLSHSSFSNPSFASPTSQFILQPFFRFSYVTSCSLNSRGEPPIH